MGSQPVQGTPPGQTPDGDGGETVFAAAGTVVGVVALIIFLIVATAYVGGWAMHVLADIAQSGWESK